MTGFISTTLVGKKELWCFIVDQENDPYEDPLLRSPRQRQISHLELKQSSQEQNAVDHCVLTIWCCKEPKLSYAEDEGIIAKRMRVNDFTDKNIVIKLRLAMLVKDLELSSNGTLLVRSPCAF